MLAESSGTKLSKYTIGQNCYFYVENGLSSSVSKKKVNA